ncbi:MAG: DUF3108 domain-containing protein [Gammaproteobacteria bacterium]
MKKYLFVIAALFIALPLWASEPKPFTAHYTVSKGSLPIGEMTRSLRVENDGVYVYESVTEPSGLLGMLVKEKVIERSMAKLVNNHLRVEQYSYEKSGGNKPPKKVQLVFDWQERIVKNTVDGETRPMPTAQGLTDILLYQLALMLDLKQGKKSLEYAIADKHKFKTYRFDFAGEETLDTPLGKLKTVKVQRVPGADGKTTLIWCAPSLDYLPVRIEQDEKDDGAFSMAIKSME